MNDQATVQAVFDQASQLFAAAAGDPALIQTLVEAANQTAEALKQGGKLLLCGNGGSAAEATHFAGELVGPFLDRKRSPLAAIPLGFDTSSQTAISNDFGFEQVYARQVAALGKPGDVLWALTTSGNSANILAAMRQAQTQKMPVILFTNHDGGQARSLCDIALTTPCAPTPRVQELHQLYGHCLCQLIEARLASQ